MPSCIVKGCGYTWKSRGTGIIMHSFPNNPIIIRQWLQQTGQFDNDLDASVEKIIVGKSSDIYRMCSKHFTDDCYMNDGFRRTLKRNSIPTIFVRTPQNCIVPKEDGPTRKKRKLSQTYRVVADQGPSTSSKPLLYHTIQIGEDNPMLFDNPSSISAEPSRVWKVVVDRGTNTDSERMGMTPKFGKKHAQTQTSVRMFQGQNETRVESSQSLPRSRTDLKDRRGPKRVDCNFHESDYEEEEEESFYVESDEEADDEAHNKEFRCIYEGPKSPVRDKKFIVFESCLNKLIGMIPCQAQSKCEDRVTHVRKSFLGSSVIVEVKCASGHTKTIWESQPRLGKQPLGDVLASAAVLYSGTSFLKILQMVKLLNMKFIRKSTYYKNQLTHLFPTLNRHWHMEQQSIITRLRDKPVCLAGDYQAARPNHVTKYYTYVMMDAETKKILGFHIQQHLPTLSQAHHKNITFKKALNRILEKGVNVKMLTTDRHIGVRKIMKDSYGDIVHRFDPWHLARSINNKILFQAKKKHCEVLSDWSLPIKSHLWWCVKTCDENKEELLDRWNALQYHVLNVHEWRSSSDYWKCQHNVGSKSTRWLLKGSLAYRRLKEIVLSPSVQRDLKRVSFYCHSDSLEIFHSACQKYRPSRLRFYMDEMVARTQLAVLDHNRNVTRIQAALKDSTTVSAPGHCAKFPRGRKALVVKTLYERKSQDFIFDLLREVVTSVRKKSKMELNLAQPPPLLKLSSRDRNAPHLDNT
ncbi:uncharacterized protein [Dendrobates tinctorius]|uniref:uncharacterized protein n=1 Tax=Dendrobates tinctorius TaxID=92724 RepID=UPI003CC93671